MTLDDVARPAIANQVRDQGPREVQVHLTGQPDRVNILLLAMLPWLEGMKFQVDITRVAENEQPGWRDVDLEVDW